MGKNKDEYVSMCTNGEERHYTYKEIFDIVKGYMEQHLKLYPTAAAVDNYIPKFLKRFTYMVKENEEVA